MAAPVVPPDDMSGVTTIWEWLKGGLGAAIGVAAGFILWTFRGGRTIGKAEENVDQRLESLEAAALATAKALQTLQETQRLADLDAAKRPTRDDLEKVRDSVQRQIQDVQRQLQESTIQILQTIRGHARTVATRD